MVIWISGRSGRTFVWSSGLTSVSCFAGFVIPLNSSPECIMRSLSDLLGALRRSSHFRLHGWSVLLSHSACDVVNIASRRGVLVVTGSVSTVGIPTVRSGSRVIGSSRSSLLLSDQFGPLLGLPFELFAAARVRQ